MKLIQEYSVKVIIFTFCLAFGLEACILIFTLLTSKSILKKIYSETISSSETKTKEITTYIKILTSNLLMTTFTDLKLISRYMYLYNKNISNQLNPKIFNIDKYKIISNDEKKLNTSEIFNKIYDTTNNSNYFDYTQYYNKIFENETNNDIILNKLLKEQEELNYIYYTHVNENIEEKNIKYILSILKSIYITRFIKKKSSMDYLRFFILNNKELIIYPPEYPSKINLAKASLIYPDINCNTTDFYFSCIYNYAINNPYNSFNNYILFFTEFVEFYNFYTGICIKFPYLKEQPNDSLLCLEVDILSILKPIMLNNTKNLEFGLISSFSFSNMTDILVLFNNKQGIELQERIDAFNNTEETPYQFIRNRFNNSLFPYFSLFHYIYFDTVKMIREHPELKINYDVNKIEEEYNEINNKIIEIVNESKNINKTNDIFNFTFEKTICRKVLIGDEYECLKDKFEMVILPLSINMNNINEQFIEINETIKDNFQIFVYSIIATNPEINIDKIEIILNAKLERIIIFYFFITVIIFCFFILFLNILSEYSFKSILELINIINRIEIDEDKREITTLEEDKSWTANNEMLNLKGFYELMRKSLIIKQVFEKELYLRKHNLEFYNLIQDIQKKNIKEICNSFLGYFHYNNNIFNLSENEFRATIKFIKENENKLKGGENNEYDDKLKDAIKRSSTVSYLNEYSNFENLDENMKDNIYLKIFKQRFIYLYAMTKFKLGTEINSGNQTTNIGQNNIAGNANKNKSKKNKEKRNNYFKDAIKNFQECKNINSLLGINQIKIIYSLIMISKSYVQLNDYKNAIQNINEALSLYFEFSKTFKDYHSKYYNPRAMLFIESNIFHNILFTFSRICNSFNKSCASNWIILKIFESSPFLLSNVHYHAGMSLLNFLDKNKSKMNKYDQNFYKNANLMKESEKTRRYFTKIVSRLSSKISGNKNKRTNTEKIEDDSISNFPKSISDAFSDTVTDRSKISSNLKKVMTTSRISSVFNSKNKRIGKTVTFCMSEKILEKVNGPEFKDVLIKYFQKYFTMNESDKFSFLQFADNGKKTAFFKLEPLNYFLVKFQKTKGTFEFTDSFTANSSSVFIELYNIFDSIMKNYIQGEESDNIIMIFIESEDIRFSSISDCLSIVDDLNKKNASVFFLVYDENVKEEKINNIQSFLNGLSEGRFFHIQNYQQLKQIFINLSTVKIQSNFFGFDYDIFDKNI